MQQDKCYELLGFRVSGTQDIEMDIVALTTAIQRSIESKLVTSIDDIEGFTIVKVFGEKSMLLKKANLSAFLVIEGFEYGHFATSSSSESLLDELYAEGLLSEFVCQSIVDEFDRLTTIDKAGRIARYEEHKRKNNLAELERLTLMKNQGLL